VTLGSTLGAVLSARLLRRALLATLAGLVIGFVVLIATSDGLRTIRGGRIGGDLPAFHGAGRIVASGRVRDLYDSDAQRAAEEDLLPASERGWIPFPYPPYVALFYVPLTWLPFKAAYVVHAIVMALCCVFAVALVRPALPALRAEFLPVVAAMLVFYPLFRAVLGGQNTPLSLLCGAAAAAALARGRDLAAGLWVGVWLFKPQLALPVAALLLIRAKSRTRFAAGVAAVAAMYFLLGVAMGGWNWIGWWWHDGAVPFAEADLEVDRGNGISFAELAYEFGVTPLKWVAAAATGVFALWTAWRHDDLHPLAVVGVAAGTAALIAPHALYYDGGLAALGLMAAGALRPALLPWIGFLWLLAWAQPFRSSLPLPPMTVVLVASMVLAARHARSGAASAAR
jgi:hypothetical protein